MITLPLQPGHSILTKLLSQISTRQPATFWLALLVLATENEQNRPPSCVGINVGRIAIGRGVGLATGFGVGLATGLEVGFASGLGDGLKNGGKDGSGVGLLTFVRPPTTSSAPLQDELPSHPIATL